MIVTILMVMMKLIMIVMMVIVMTKIVMIVMKRFVMTILVRMIDIIVSFANNYTSASYYSQLIISALLLST